MFVDPANLDVIAPNFKRRWSGVSSTVIRLVPLQAEQIGIASSGPRLPDDVPRVAMGKLLTMSRSGPHGARVWHARRNIEMLAGLVLRSVFRKRLRLIFTSAKEGERSKYTHWLMQNADVVVATSGRAAAHLNVPARVIHHGVDAAVFHHDMDQEGAKRELGLDPASIYVGCFGRLRPDKGTALFLDAMIALLPQRPSYRAVIMGTVTRKFSSFLMDLKARVSAAGLTDKIHFLPEATLAQMPRWYQAVDLYVVPSLKEGFGLTPLESMACGTPVVATTAGAFEELVVHEGTGLIVPVNDPPALQAAIARALDNPDERRAWGVAGPAHVAEHFRIEDEAAALVAIYRELLGVE